MDSLYVIAADDLDVHALLIKIIKNVCRLRTDRIT